MEKASGRRVVGMLGAVDFWKGPLGGELSADWGRDCCNRQTLRHFAAEAFGLAGAALFSQPFVRRKRKIPPVFQNSGSAPGKSRNPTQPAMSTGGSPFVGLRRGSRWGDWFGLRKSHGGFRRLSERRLGA